MRPRGFAFAAALIAFVCLSAPSSAQSFDLRDLLTDFLREGITLAPPPAGFSCDATTQRSAINANRRHAWSRSRNASNATIATAMSPMTKAL